MINAKMLTLPLIGLCILLNTGAQILLKMGARTFGDVQVSWQNLLELSLRLALNPAIFFGLVLYVLSVALWIFVLARVEVSYAYPLSSLGYVLTALVGAYYLGESLSLTRWCGIFVILVGVYLVTRS
ncbi:MAG: SMR family transporter [Alphaproteobacteria bacterium]|jgi:multidrug transporter EmrE-like cation transporter|nr:SMR family transporter [Alphaproteobacteria bacterium]